MTTSIHTCYGTNSRQIKPAILNLFQANNNVDAVEFQMENYVQDNVDLSTLDPYVICHGSEFVGGLDEVKLTSEVTADGLLRVYWDVTLMTLSSPQTITAQLVFKNDEGAVWTSHKFIVFCNESLTADEEIVAQYPTILKQMEGRIETKTDEAIDGVVEEITNGVSDEVSKAVTQINQIADNFDASVVYIPYGEKIPVENRVSNRLYYQYMNAEHTKGRFEDSNGTILIVDESGAATYAPIGAIIPVNTASNFVPEGCLPCDGGEYSKEIFKDLWNNWLYTGFEIKSQYEGLIGYESSGRPSVEIAEMRFNTDCDHVTIDEGIDWSLCFNLYDVTTSQKLCSVYNSGMSSWVDVVVEGGELKMTLFGSLSSIETVSTGNLYVKREDETIWYSLNGSEWEGVFSVGSGASQFGSEDLRGYVNLFESYINGVQLAVERSVGLLNTCTYAEYEQDLVTYGQCSKFAVDVDGEMFKVPTIKDGAVVQQAMTNDELGKVYNAGLPNITGTWQNYQNGYGAGSNSQCSYSGALYNAGSNKSKASSGDSASSGYVIGFDASLSNAIYGNSDTVQMDAVAVRYFVVVANGQINENMLNWNDLVSSLQNMFDDIELNNPFSLLDYKYSEYELNNLSWLRSNGQYNPKAIYPAVYDLLLKIYNGTETKAGVSVKLSTEAFTDYDFVLNTAEETFRLPIKVKGASGKAVVGNGMTLGLTNGTENYGAFGSSSASNGICLDAQLYGEKISTSYQTADASNNTGLGVTTDPTKSGIETSDNDLYLYFYVGETVQNANLINAGRIEEALVTKTDKVQAAAAGMLSSKYIDLTLGASGTTYTAPASGWFYIHKTLSGTSQYLNITNTIKGYAVQEQPYPSGANIKMIFPVQKGDDITITYNVGGATNYFRFYYAEGEA